MNPPSFSEEKLTAYALNELSPEERREVETELAKNPELKAELEAIQLLAGQLREELSLEAVEFEKSPMETLQPSGSDTSGTIEPDDEKIISIRRHPWFFASGLLAAAACAALMFLPSLSLPLRDAKKSYPTTEAELSATSPAPAPEPEESIVVDTQPLMVMDESPAEVPASPLPAEIAELKEMKPGSVVVTGGLPSQSFEMQLDDSALVANTDQPADGTKLTRSAAPVPASGRTTASVSPAKIARREMVLYEVSSAYSPPVPAAAPAARGSAIGGSSKNALSTPAAEAPMLSSSSLPPNQERAGTSLRRLRPSSASGESYTPITDNSFLRVTDQALSTFSIDVDTGAYTNLRRFLNQGQLPPPDAVRIEELVNYFNYNYPQPTGEDPFSVNTEVAKAPWKNDHLLVRIGLQGKTVAVKDRPAANLVFLIDVSGSMNEPNKLPLVVESMKLLVQKLKPEDRVGIAVYAGNSGMVLPSTPVSDRAEILEALSELQAGGSTNGAMGIQLAYDMAKAHFIEGGINRVILCTDGDFNVGVTNRGDLVKLIEKKAKSKVFLSVFGFGMGNLKDDTLEQLANKGNGNYGYIDNPKEAKRVFVEQVGGTLQTIAKDVKIQVEFNPAVVASYRLIGYENRMLAARDFNDDKKDAGEIGAGHRVTALYEIVPVGVKEDSPSIDPLKYQKAAPVEYAGDKSEIMNVKLRYKQPEGDTSKLIEYPVKNENIRSFTASKGWFRSNSEVASDDFQFAAGVAAFGMILRDSPYKGDTGFDLVLQLTGKGAADRQDDRAEFIALVKKARTYFEEPKPKVQEKW